MNTQNTGAGDMNAEAMQTSDFRKSGLTREDELLLSRHYDGECGFVERWKVKRLLARTPAAEQYLDSLNEVGEQLCIYETSVVRDENGDSIKVDLWDRIAGRIENEEHAALFLGDRRMQKGGEPSIFKFDLSGLLWGVSGSVTTAAIVFMSLGLGVFSGADGRSGNDQFSAAFDTEESGSVKKVSMVKREIPAHPASRPIEVDWVRSDGRVHVIPDPSERSAIIWVKRNRVPVIDVDQLRNKPSEERVDRPVIIEDDLPRSLSVAGPGRR